MRGLTVVPHQLGSLAVTDVDEPVAADGELLVDGLAVGVCGTDREIVAGEYGWAPPGRERLVLGHESLGRVRTAPEGSGFAPGDLVVVDALSATGSYGVTCLTGVTSAGRRLSFDAGALNREIVLENDAVIGSVNANLTHYRAGADALARADTGWLGRIVTDRVPLEDAVAAFGSEPDGIKTVLEL
jgi:threonine dehydrogenase-like Zn-dependent dehydrogenase